VVGRIRDEPESSTSKRQRTTTKGTIVRLRMHNFMSYSDAELFADPCKLNCIIGRSLQPGLTRNEDEN